MRNKKKLLTIICSFILMSLVIINFFGCDSILKILEQTSRQNYITQQYYIIKDGDVIYYEDKKTGEYHLMGNSEGKYNSEVWHINPYYDGKEITFLGAFINGCHEYEAPVLSNVKEVFLPYCMTMDGRSNSTRYGTEAEWPTKNILVQNKGWNEVILDIERNDYEREGYIREIFISSPYYDEMVPARKEYYISNFVGSDSYYYDERREIQIYEYSNESIQFITIWEGAIKENYKICKANTSYLFNYEDSPNDGYFFINDFEYGKTIENTPYEPLRAGYTFGGWYKEPACINAWNFETDTLPSAQYNEDGQELYQETKLYAKWIEE